MTDRAFLRYAFGVVMSIIGLAMLVSCAAGPKRIEYGAAECAYCRMEITDPRFGAQAVTAKGKVMSFDSIECLADYVAAAASSGAAPAAFVSDWQNPGALMPVDSARLLRVDGPAGSPMGQGLLAVRAGADVATLALELGAQPVEWSAVLARADRARATNVAGSITGDGDGRGAH